MPNVLLACPVSEGTKEYFSSNDYFSLNLELDAGGGGMRSSKTGGSAKQIFFFLILSDHEDMEAVSVSRLFQHLIASSLKHDKLGFDFGKNQSKGSMKALQKQVRSSAVVQAVPGEIELHCVEDQDLPAQDFHDIAKQERAAVVLLTLTTGTLKSATQLSRLGLLHKHTPDLQPIPVVIGATFNFPTDDYYMHLEKGDGLGLGKDPEGAIKLLCNESVPFFELREALEHAMSFFVTFIDVPKFTELSLRKQISGVIRRAAVASHPDEEVKAGNRTSQHRSSRAAGNIPHQGAQDTIDDPPVKEKEEAPAEQVEEVGLTKKIEEGDIYIEESESTGVARVRESKQASSVRTVASSGD